ncbi:MAG: zf-HC2 domain-containing protein, partial [Solirubrobacterales bacterium]
MGKHESIRRQLAGLALGELSERERSEILVHVGRCDRCRAELARIERLLGLAGKRKGLSADESLLASARDRLFAATRDESKAETAARPHSRWALAGRRIMRSRIAQLATAAVVVVALSIAFKMSSASRLDAAELLAQAARNMGKLAWIKTVTQVYVPDRNEPVETDVSWTDAANRRDYIIFDNKYIHMAD